MMARVLKFIAENSMISTTSRSNVGETSPPPARNEPVRDYAPGSPERTELAATLARMAGDQIELPMTIGGREVRTGALQDVVSPHDHRGVLAKAHVEGGRTDRAAELLAEFAAAGFELPLDQLWLTGMVDFAEAAIECRDPVYAGPLLAQLEPWAAQLPATGASVVMRTKGMSGCEARRTAAFPSAFHANSAQGIRAGTRDIVAKARRGPRWSSSRAAGSPRSRAVKRAVSAAISVGVRPRTRSVIIEADACESEHPSLANRTSPTLSSEPLRSSATVTVASSPQSGLRTVAVASGCGSVPFPCGCR